MRLDLTQPYLSKMSLQRTNDEKHRIDQLGLKQLFSSLHAGLQCSFAQSTNNEKCFDHNPALTELLIETN